MTDFTEKLRLKGKADEDLYFARIDRELIAARDARRAALPAEIRSGGQTGVDRGALDAALEAAASSRLQVGGWCPRGRLAEDGIIPARYPLRETPLARPAQRTEWNVRDTDGTLILLDGGPPGGGTALTARIAERLGKPLLVLRADEAAAVQAIRDWLRLHRISVLNVAGPRESEAPGIADKARRLLLTVLAPETPPARRPR